ncbi:hypothetical protein [Enterobacter roggenkampii]|uniref:hypothetical protein n=1 Tax=Enterobacter roggenkampii TaxID=1812935 RepID=UPI0025ACEEAE|nr:hypothetical protein [Enterobacter roggenkampii]WJS49459.1 hypothetical protein QU521_15040 [Enterobacter roggenkampii]
MSTITKEQIEQYANAAKLVQVSDLDRGKLITVAPEHMLELARIALASLEVEPVAFVMADDLKDSSIISTPAYRDLGEAMERTVGDVVALYAAPPAPANADPVAWLWSHRKHPSEVTLVRPEDDERAEGAHWSGWSCQALYSAQPVPASVPVDFLCMLTGRAKYLRDKGEIKSPELLERAAAMLQVAEPVTTAYKLPELTDSQCLEFLAVAFRHASIKGDIEFDDIRLGLKMALDAAPQQEVKP